MIERTWVTRRKVLRGAVTEGTSLLHLGSRVDLLTLAGAAPGSTIANIKMVGRDVDIMWYEPVVVETPDEAEE